MFKCMSFRLDRLCSSREGWDSVHRFNQLNGITPTDLPLSIYNRCVIEVFGGVFLLSVGFKFVTVMAAVVTELSQISHFFSSSLKILMFCLLCVLMYSIAYVDSHCQIECHLPQIVLRILI